MSFRDTALDLPSRSRRALITRSLVAAGCLLAPGLAGCRGGNRVSGGAGREKLGEVPFVGEGDAAVDVPVGEEMEGRLYTDLSRLDPSLSTIPTERFFIRTRASAFLRPGRWRVRVGKEELPLPVERIVQRSEPRGRHLMECAGNAREAHFGMLGVAEWSGVPLMSILQRMERPKGRYRVLVSGFDRYRGPIPASSVAGCAWVFSPEEIEASGAFLAAGMNGRPLTPDHGAPVRLVVPGWYGCASVKWVDRILLVGDDAPATSQMQEYASRTGQQGLPRLARDHQPARIEPSAMPLRVEKWRVKDGLEYSVTGIAWGGSPPVKEWEIRFSSDAPYVPVERMLQGDEHGWTFWTHTWRPAGPGTYTIRLRTPATGIGTGRLDTGLYSRTVEIV